MKKIIGIMLTVIGIIVAFLSLIFKVNRQTSAASSISIIGGADGPTSIFLAGKVGNTFGMIGMIVAIVLLVVGIFMIVKKK